MNFATLRYLTIPEGNVRQITDSSGRVLWEKWAKITITNSSSVPPGVVGGTITVNGTQYNNATTITVPLGTVITCTAWGTKRTGTSTITGGNITLNGAVIASGSETSDYDATCEYTVQDDILIDMKTYYVPSGIQDGMVSAGDIAITEL